MKIERKSSIESEPRTLTVDQIKYARDAALYVLSTKTIEEAISIFTEGLKPVLSITNDMEHQEAEMLDGLKTDDPSLPMLKRDIVSAPF